MISIANTNQPYAPYMKDYCFAQYDDRGNLVYAPESEFTKLYASMPGQIHRDTPFGKELYSLAANSGLNYWVEVGTWNGLGTTTCILDGFRDRADKSMIPHLASIELDPVLFNAAEANLKSHPMIRNVVFMKGKLMPYSMKPCSTFPTPAELGDTECKLPHFYMHYDRERVLYENANPVLLPFFPEVAVLDGGEYSGYMDWLHLEKSGLKYLCLDDTNVTKNRRVISELGSEWKCIASGNDKSGWAIYKRN
jgi:hypothetical protein